MGAIHERWSHVRYDISRSLRPYSRAYVRRYLRPFLIKMGLSKTDGTTTGQDGASLPQLVAISSPWWRDGADGTAIIAN